MSTNAGGNDGGHDNGDDGRHSVSFEERLQAARTRQGLDSLPAVPSQGSRLNASALSIGLRVGLELVSALVVSVFIGWWLDRWLHTSPVLLAVFVVLGWAAGIANVWRLMGAGQTAAGDNRTGDNRTGESRPDERINVVTGRPRGGPAGKGRDSGG